MAKQLALAAKLKKLNNALDLAATRDGHFHCFQVALWNMPYKIQPHASQIIQGMW